MAKKKAPGRVPAVGSTAQPLIKQKIGTSRAAVCTHRRRWPQHPIDYASERATNGHRRPDAAHREYGGTNSVNLL